AGYLIDRDAVVTSHACENISAVYHQKSRWIRGGMELGTKGYLIGLGSALLHAAIIISIFSAPKLLPLLIAGKLVSDLIVIFPTLVRTHSITDIAYFFFYEVYAFFLVITLPIVWIGARRKVVWKGREYF